MERRRGIDHEILKEIMCVVKKNGTIEEMSKAINKEVFNLILNKYESRKKGIESAIRCIRPVVTVVCKDEFNLPIEETFQNNHGLWKETTKTIHFVVETEKYTIYLYCCLPFI